MISFKNFLYQPVNTLSQGCQFISLNDCFTAPQQCEATRAIPDYAARSAKIKASIAMVN